MENVGQVKTKEEILNQTYISGHDLKILLPNIGQHRCTEYIKEIQDEMREKNMFIPKAKEYLAHIKLVKKKFNM